MIARYVRHVAAFVLAAAAIPCAVIPGAAAQPPAIVKPMARDPGSPPAFRLPSHVTPERYEATLSIDPRSPGFSGEIAIDVRIERATDLIWLNATELAVQRAELRQGDRASELQVVAGGEDFVGLRGEFAPGRARLAIAYRGKVDNVIVEGVFRQQERGDWYVLTQFQPIGARRAFPCFDEPQWKTPWTVTIDAPSSDVVVANTPEVSAAPVDGRPGWMRHRFAATRPLPSYLVAFAVGPYDVVDGGVAGRQKTPLRYLTPRGRGAEARYAKEATPALLERLEEYFGIPYPFEKLDSIAIPQLATFAAMENVGLVTYGSQYLLARAHEETEHFRQTYAVLAAHEVAHMWFGNLATLAWWEDTWLNEAFASWISTKVAYAYQPKWNTGEYRSHTRGAALEADRLASARRIRTPVTSRNAIDDSFDDITYNKGEEVLSMFEAWLGPERFRAGVRRFLERHAWRSATSDDFFRALGEAAGDASRVVEALRGFVDQPGAPLIETFLDCTGPASLVVEQRRFRPEGTTAPDLAWTTPACFRYRVGEKDHTHCAAIDAFTRRIALPQASTCPAWVVGNAGGMGHYVTRYYAPQLVRTLAQAAQVPSFEMQVLVNDTRLMARSGMLPNALSLQVAEAALRHPAPMVELAGVELLEGLRDGWLKAPEKAQKARIVRERVIPRARTLGWNARAGDSDESKALRASLLPFAAQSAEGAALRGQARSLALGWLRDTTSLDADAAPAVIDTAGRFADAATFDEMQKVALSTESQRERVQLLGALAKARDPALRARALALALGPLDARSALSLLGRGLRDPDSRRAAFDYVRANVDAIERKLPRDTITYLFAPMGELCSPEQRDAFAAAFGERAPRYMAGKLRYEQALEAIDLCVSAHR